MQLQFIADTESIKEESSLLYFMYHLFKPFKLKLDGKFPALCLIAAVCFGVLADHGSSPLGQLIKDTP